MLMPKRTKHRKTFRVKYDGKAKGNTELQKKVLGSQVNKLKQLVLL